MKLYIARSITLFSILFLSFTHGQTDSESEAGSGESYKIEGKVIPPDNPPPDWLSITTVSIDGGKRRAFLKEDNSFVIQVNSQLN